MNLRKNISEKEAECPHCKKLPSDLFLDKLQEEEKVTIVMVTHEEYIAKYAERIIRLKDGKIVDGG